MYTGTVCTVGTICTVSPAATAVMNRGQTARLSGECTVCTVGKICTVSPAATAVMSREADSQAVRIGGESELPSQEPGKAGLYCTVLCKGNDKRDVVQRTKRVEFRITALLFMPRLCW